MQCQQCGYLLFNLPGCVCPECNSPFAVTDFSFDRGAVHFCCPHCGQEYEGNDERGLPSPRSFTCVSCGQPVVADTMPVVPQADNALGTYGVYGTSPWDKRDRTGFWPAWWGSVKMIMLKPTMFFRLHREPSNRAAYGFAVVCAYLGPGVGLALAGFLIMAMTAGWQLGSGGTTGFPAGIELIGVIYWVGAVVYPPILPLLYGILNGAASQLMLLVLAPQRRSFGYTYRAYLYSMAPSVLCAVPSCGFGIAGVWMLVTLTVALREVHRISTWRAVVCACWLPLLSAIVYVVVMVTILLSPAQPPLPIPVTPPAFSTAPPLNPV